MKSATGKKKKVLIVDDNMCCREIVKAICLKAGFELIPTNFSPRRNVV